MASTIQIQLLLLRKTSVGVLIYDDANAMVLTHHAFVKRCENAR